MSYALVDDKAPRHPKFLRAGPEACWLWVHGLCFCKEYSTDGHIPDDILETFPGLKNHRRLADRLVSVGLWERVESGWLIHDYLENNDDRETVERRRRQARERKQKWKDKQAERKHGTRSERVPERRQERSGNGSQTETETETEKIPPTPRTKPRDPLAYLNGGAPYQRADVREVFELFCETFGFTGRKLEAQNSRLDAETIADAVDAYGLEACLRVCRHAPTDPMVSGEQDDRGRRHESVKYIFGNSDAFARIERASRNAEPDQKRGSVRDAIDASKALGDRPL